MVAVTEFEELSENTGVAVAEFVELSEEVGAALAVSEVVKKPLVAVAAREL